MIDPGAVNVTERIDQLRADFDRSFTEPARSLGGEQIELLAVGVGDRPYAIRLAQAAGLHPDRPVTELPSPVPQLLGVAGFAGAVVPVYDLAALLGHPIPQRPRWLVLAAGAPALALAFHALEHHVRVPTEAIIADEDLGRLGCARGVVKLPDGNRPIVDLAAARAIVQQLTGDLRRAAPTRTKEKA